MYAAEVLIRERQQETVRRAQWGQPARTLVQLRKLQRRRQRAERELLKARQRLERLRAQLETIS